MTQNEKPNRYNEISRKYGDPWIWGIFIMLVIISIIESYSASSREVAKVGVYAPLIKQCAFLGIGSLIVVGLRRVNYNNAMFLYIAVPILALFTVFSLVYVMKFGDMINGARRSMTIIRGLPSIQPSEFAKLSIVTLLSYIFAKTQKNRDISTKGLIWAAVAVAVYGGLMYKSGLTNTLLLMAISGSMLLIGGAKVKKICMVMVFFGFVVGFIYIVKSKNDDKEQLIKEVKATMPNANMDEVEELVATKSKDDEIGRESCRERV